MEQVRAAGTGMAAVGKISKDAFSKSKPSAITVTTSSASNHCVTLRHSRSSYVLPAKLRGQYISCTQAKHKRRAWRGLTLPCCRRRGACGR
jgi:hypothetical protein